MHFTSERTEISVVAVIVAPYCYSEGYTSHMITVKKQQHLSKPVDYKTTATIRLKSFTLGLSGILDMTTKGPG